MRGSANLALFGLMALTGLAGCGSSSDSGANVEILDPAKEHYGKTYAGFIADWMTYVYKMSPPTCFNAILDDNGADCALYQDPASPVFFLVGNYGGVTRRKNCPVPKDKALFFPIMNVWGDNAGVPADMVLSDAELKNYAEQTFATYEVSSLTLVVDGHKVSGLASTAVASMPYVITLEAGKSPYDCMGIPDVAGDFPGYVGGYWALLAPLGRGEHTLTFGGHVASPTPANDITVDAGYTFTLE